MREAKAAEVVRLRKGRAKLDQATLDEFFVRPDPGDPRLTSRVQGLDEHGRRVETAVVTERPLTLYLNRQEIVTMMTIGDHPDYLAVGYLLNQNMLRADDEIETVDHDEELDVVVVRTRRETDYEEKLQKRIQTSGCGQGTVFGDLMERLDEIRLAGEAGFHTIWAYSFNGKIHRATDL